MTKNPERKVAEQFDRERDPLEKYSENMNDIDVDYFEYYYCEYIEERDIKQETKDHYYRSYQNWKNHMEQFERHATLPNEDHVEQFVDNCLKRMKGEACRKRLRHIKGVYEYMQQKPAFPHPTNYNPFLNLMNKREADLSESQPDEYPTLQLDDIKSEVQNIKHIGERAVTVFALKTGVRSSELGNIQFEDIHITNNEILSHYDGEAEQKHDQMGSDPRLDGIVNAVYIPSREQREGNKREVPSVIPLDEETRRVLIDWLLIRPDNGNPHVFLTQKGKPMDRNSLRHVWTKHWWPEYEYKDNDKLRSISPHYARHWYTTWFRAHAGLDEPLVKYLRGDKPGSEFSPVRSAMHRYVHTRYDDVEAEYRNEIFKLGI